MAIDQEEHITINQIVRYTALIKRSVEISLSSGVSWKPEYEEELRDVQEEILKLRREMDLPLVEKGL